MIIIRYLTNYRSVYYIHMDNLILKIGKDIVGKDNDPIYRYDQIPGSIKYRRTGEYAKLNCHLGQRKLLLNELQFYASFLPREEDHLVIYAGSASAEHMPIILEHFPSTKFLLIDPNYHNIDLSEVKYVYQDPDKVSDENLREFKNYIKYHGNLDRLKHLKRGAERLTKMKFLPLTGDDKRSKSKRSKPRKDSMLHQTYNVIETVDEELSNILLIKEYFYHDGHKNLISDIFEDDGKVFIIQDYMTQLLSENIREALDNYGKKMPVYFVTDIRTTIVEQSVPGDLDIIWNSCLQIIFLRILEPKMSMLKFHPPYFKESDKKDIERFVNGEFSFGPIIQADIDWVKKETKIDFIKEYLKGNFRYFKSNKIFLQPWAPRASSESRLIVAQKDLDTFVKYDGAEWENRYIYLNKYRPYAYHSIWIKIFEQFKLDYDYDGCFDCSLEILILAHLLNSENKSKENKSKESKDNIDFRKLKMRMKRDYYFTRKILDLYRKINKITFFDLRNNYKCPSNRFVFSVPDEVVFYRLEDMPNSTSELQKKKHLKVTLIGTDGKEIYEIGLVTAEVVKHDNKYKLGNIYPRSLTEQHPRVVGVFNEFLSRIMYFSSQRY